MLVCSRHHLLIRYQSTFTSKGIWKVSGGCEAMKITISTFTVNFAKFHLASYLACFIAVRRFLAK